MKKILAGLALMILSWSAVAVAQSAKPRTVKDFYMQIPAPYITAEAAKRALWIDVTDDENQFLSLEIPAKDVLGEADAEKARIYGEVKLLQRKSGTTLVGQTLTLCVEGLCQSQALLLEYAGGRWKDISEELLPKVSNEEAIQILRSSKSYDKPLKEGLEVPLVIGFTQNNQINFGAAIKPDGRTLAGIKTFAWDGVRFTEVTYEEGP